jgi:hypothetical protein
MASDRSRNHWQMSRLPPVLSDRDLPLSELQAARLDGEVYRVDECFSPIDEIEQRDHRGLALAAVFPPRLIAEQRTAAWVLGALARPPTRHQFCAAITTRVRPTGLGPTTVREVVIAPEEVLDCGGQAVTTPLRTAVDLARFSPEFADDEFRVVITLMRLGRFGVHECGMVLDRRRNLPNKRIALTRLREAARRAQPPLTRYTS